MAKGRPGSRVIAMPTMLTKYALKNTNNNNKNTFYFYCIHFFATLSSSDSYISGAAQSELVVLCIPIMRANWIEKKSADSSNQVKTGALRKCANKSNIDFSVTSLYISGHVLSCLS